MSKGGALANLPLSDLNREIARRQRTGKTILRKRERLAAKLQALDSQIAEMGLTKGVAGLGARTRPKNEMNLVAALAKVLDGKTMSVTDVSEAVQKAGYKTTSPSFRTIVNQTLINSGKFKRIERGQYTAK
jgi:hypothetical protein